MGTVVTLSEMQPEIARIHMHDEENKNVFTPQFMSELTEAFRQVDENEHYKTVILTGLGHYFMCGATQDILMAMHERKIQFAQNANQTDLYGLALRCKIPVIAAMEGHAIGGGLVFAMYSDLVVLARESIYAANFMNYGFTPGFGATYILPKKLGFALAEEMMMTAAHYRGAELEKRGVPFRVLPKAEVLECAVEMAERLAEKTRSSLILLKQTMTAEMKQGVMEAVQQELQMHAQTITSQEAGRMIQERY